MSPHYEQGGKYDAGFPQEFQLALAVRIDGATDEEVAAATQEVNDWIRRAGPDCEVASVMRPSPRGTKGLLTVLGGIGLKFLEPGSVKALIDCLAVYIKERRKEVVVTVKAANGASIEIRAGGFGRGGLEQIADMSQSLLAATTGSSGH